MRVGNVRRGPGEDSAIVLLAQLGAVGVADPVGILAVVRSHSRRVNCNGCFMVGR